MIDQFHPVLTTDHVHAVSNAIKSGWINEGELVRQFETKFAEKMGTRYAVACTSGSTALFLALKTNNRHSSTEVPDYTFAADPNMVLWADATPVLKDVDKRGLLNSHYTPRVSVAMNGRFPDQGYARGLIEDRSQALGKHQLWGDMAVYSLAASKHLTTGQGGMVTTDSEQMALRLRKLKNQGRLDGSDSFPENGFNFKMTDLQASLGLVGLSYFDAKVSKIWRIYLQYREHLSQYFLNRTKWEVPWYVDIYVQDPDAVAKALWKKNVGTRRHYKPLHTHPAFKHYSDSEYPGSQWFYDHGLYLPSSEDLKDSEIDMICKVIKDEKPRLPESLQ